MRRTCRSSCGSWRSPRCCRPPRSTRRSTGATRSISSPTSGSRCSSSARRPPVRSWRRACPPTRSAGRCSRSASGSRSGCSPAPTPRRARSPPTSGWPGWATGSRSWRCSARRPPCCCCSPTAGSCRAAGGRSPGSARSGWRWRGSDRRSTRRPLGEAELPNPLGADGAADELVRGLIAVTDVLALPLLLAAAASLVVRFRRARGVERLQLKWFTFDAAIAGAALGLAGTGTGIVADTAFIVGLLALAALPVTAGLAILRYRLYDIDVVIRRTLVYARAHGDPRRRPTSACVLLVGLAVGRVGLRGRGVHAGGGRRCSARRSPASRRSSTGASSAAATTRPARSRSSAAGCATRSTSRRWRRPARCGRRDRPARPRLAVAAEGDDARGSPGGLWLADRRRRSPPSCVHRRGGRGRRGLRRSPTRSSSARSRPWARSSRAGSPRNPIGWILLAGGACVHDRRADDRRRRRARAAPRRSCTGSRPGCGWPASARSPPSGCCCSPTGTCRRRAGGPFAWFAAAAIVVTAAVIAFKPGPFEDDPRREPARHRRACRG